MSLVTPTSNQTSADPRPNWKDYSPAFNRAMLTGLKVQAALAVVTALVLDGGRCHRVFWIALLCQWATVFIILLRRPMAPTRLDLAIVRYGIFPLFIVVLEFGPAILRLLDVAGA